MGCDVSAVLPPAEGLLQIAAAALAAEKAAKERESEEIVRELEAGLKEKEKERSTRRRSPPRGVLGAPSSPVSTLTQTHTHAATDASRRCNGSWSSWRSRRSTSRYVEGGLVG